MELKDFVKETLISVVGGVKEAQNVLAGMNTNESIKVGQFSIQSWDSNDEGRFISFDVAVTTTSEKSGKTEAGGKVLVANANIGGELKHSTENISRVKFKVCCATT